MSRESKEIAAILQWTLDVRCSCGAALRAIIQRPLDNEMQRVSFWSRHTGEGHGKERDR